MPTITCFELPAIAAARARSLLGKDFSGKNIVILGDTIFDIRCGSSLGVKSIAVGTGHASDESVLRAENPDFYFSDFSHTKRVIQAILE